MGVDHRAAQIVDIHRRGWRPIGVTIHHLTHDDLRHRRRGSGAVLELAFGEHPDHLPEREHADQLALSMTIRDPMSWSAIVTTQSDNMVSGVVV
jgi:hypothetical protein